MVCCSRTLCVPVIAEVQLLTVWQPRVLEVIVKRAQIAIDDGVMSPGWVSQVVIADNSDIIGRHQRNGSQAVKPATHWTIWHQYVHRCLAFAMEEAINCVQFPDPHRLSVIHVYYTPVHIFRTNYSTPCAVVHNYPWI